MTPGARVNAVLAVALAALIALAWYAAREAPDADARLAEIDPATVATVRIERRGAEPIEIVREDDGWTMTAPRALAVEPRKVEDLIASLNVTSHAHYAMSELDSEDLGVGETPEVRVSIDDEVFQVGRTTPISDWRYVRHGDTVHLVTDVVEFRTRGDAWSWAERKVLPSDADIERIEVGDAFTIARTDPGWVLTPEDTSVSADAMQRLVDAWAGAEAFQVAPHQGGEAFDHRVRVHLAGRADPIAFGLILAEGSASVVRADTGIVYRLPVYEAESLFKLARAD